VLARLQKEKGQFYKPLNRLIKFKSSVRILLIILVLFLQSLNLKNIAKLRKFSNSKLRVFQTDNGVIKIWSRLEHLYKKGCFYLDHFIIVVKQEKKQLSLTV
jgi:low affinity Fe/Cu permease